MFVQRDDSLVPSPEGASLARRVATLCEALRPKFLSIARRRVGADDAEDIVQDTIAGALASIDRKGFELRGPIENWLYGILIRRIRDYWRVTGRRLQRLTSLEAVDAGGIATPGDSTEETRLLVRKILDRMPARERVVLLLNLQDGRTTREIAPYLGLGRKTAEAVLTAAKRRFRKLASEVSENSDRKRLQE